MRLVRLTATLAVALATGCVYPGPGISPYGKRASLKGEQKVTGELLAVGADSIWLLSDGFVTGYRAASIDKINVERHPFNGHRTFLAVGGIGVGTGVALTIACASYTRSRDTSPTDCLPVLPATALLFMILGTPFIFSNSYSSSYHLVPADSLRLRSYARFPQGLPDSLRARRNPTAAGVTRQP